MQDTGVLMLPTKIASWYAMIIINGTDPYGYPNRCHRPIISTGYHPIYDTRLGRSNWTIDEPKIVKIKCMITSYGFDCSAIGKEFIALYQTEKIFLILKKGRHLVVIALFPC